MNKLTEAQQKEYSEAYKFWLRQPVFDEQPWTPIKGEVEAVVIMLEGKIIPEEVITVLGETKGFSEEVKTIIMDQVNVHNQVITQGVKIKPETLVATAVNLQQWICLGYEVGLLSLSKVEQTMKFTHQVNSKVELFKVLVENRIGNRASIGPFKEK
ncbi:MAG: hypothetical protein V1810_02180 [Candidatus Beckwithbacteria bacterium]